MNKIPLSVVIITRNEASRISDCLKSVEWAAEIIVVDDGSADATLDIARAAGAKTFSRRMDIEGKHRNWAYDQASHEWVLSLDADERVTPQLRDEIAALLAEGPLCNGYAIPRRNFVGQYWAKYGGMYPSAQLRLFKKKEFRYDEKAEVHPQAYMKDPRGTLKNDIIHYTYRDFADMIAKLDRHTDLEARKWVRENRKVGMPSTVRKMIDRFCKQYFTKKGRKDGVIGLFLAVNSAMYQFLTYVKVWEIRKGLVTPDGVPAQPIPGAPAEVSRRHPEARRAEGSRPWDSSPPAGGSE
jgi:glycosyltransferase involved in cell wall biosynthesis